MAIPKQEFLFTKKRFRTFNQKRAPAESSKRPPCVAKGGRERKGCWAQLIWNDGKPSLRFCAGLKKSAFTVPVANVEEAWNVAQQVCECSGNGRPKKKCAPEKRKRR